jgi:glucokinase
MIGAVDIGGTKIAVGIVDRDGRVLSPTETPSEVDRSYEEGLQRVVNMLRRSLQDSGQRIDGIGIGSTGPVNPVTGEFGDVDFLPRWRGKNPVRDLAEIFKVRVALENDADAGALGEAAWGSGKNRPRLVYVTVGTGIGGGILLNGQLYRGVDGAHPEIGHQVIDPSGPDCSCGFRGCWEALASGPAMAAWFERERASESESQERVSAELICQMARQNDPAACKAVTREAYYLGLGIANLINLFTPDAIVLAGSLMKSADLFLERIRDVIRRGCRFVPFEKTELVLASLGENANLIGAARVWYHRFGQQQVALTSKS